MKKGLLVISAVWALLNASGQEYLIGQASVSDCNGFLFDSGGPGTTSSAGENLTTTVCPDGSGDPITSLTFSVFSMGFGDVLTIYDGLDATAPVIGSYAGNDLQGESVIATNQSGCLTLQFVSDFDLSFGNFVANISCGIPCDRPIPVINAINEPPSPVLICQGETVNLNAGNSIFAQGTSVGAFTWDFDDGTTNSSSWPQVSHTFNEAGAYRISLDLSDSQGCESNAVTDFYVYVSTTPDVDLDLEDNKFCLGQEVSLNTEVTPVTWTEEPSVDFGDGLFIPDSQEECFYSELTFSSFEPGATIQSVQDIESVFVNMEHSYLGDLLISLICPNNQYVTLHYMGGFFTTLGDPVDVEGSDVPGVGWDYYWAPDAPLGTWEDEAWEGINIAENGSLIPGTYTSYEPFDYLIGCPLNGTWSIEVCDVFAEDNGFIFDWTVAFAEELYGSNISYTPVIPSDCSSVYWTGPYLSNAGNTCDDVLLLPTEPGIFSYTLTIKDDFGCTYTEDISVEAYSVPIANAGEDVPFCNSPVQLNGSITNPTPGLNYVYRWNPGSPVLSGSTSPNPTVQSIQQETVFTLMVYPSGDPQCAGTDDVLVFIPETPPSNGPDSLEFCVGELIPLEANFVQDDCDYVWEYNEEEGLTTVQNGGLTYAASKAGEYILTITEPYCGYSGKEFFVTSYRPCELIIPNIITPDGNVANQFLVIDGLENYPGSTIRIFNRWGALVYESDDYRNNWSPADESEGVYFYILGVTKTSGEKEFFESDLTVIRK